jgi:hypothetical protein
MTSSIGKRKDIAFKLQNLELRIWNPEFEDRIDGLFIETPAGRPESGKNVRTVILLIE